MARMHGSSIRLYIDTRDYSGDIMNITPTATANVHDVTTFASAGWMEAQSGLLYWDAQLDGFYDGTAGGIGRDWETLLGAAGMIISIYDGLADGIGDSGLLLSDAILTKRSQPIAVNDLIKLKGTIRAASSPSGVAGLRGILLHPLAAESATGNSASVDNGASSANGGRANLHATAATGTGGTIKIQHSTDNAIWADLLTFSALSAAGTQTLEVAGTVNRYLREVHTIGGASTLTYVIGFARY